MFKNTAMFILFCHLIPIKESLDCTENKTIVGHEQAPVNLLFNNCVPINVSEVLVYAILMGDEPVLNILYTSGNIIANETHYDVKTIGDLKAGNLSIRIPKMNITYERLFMLTMSSPEQVVLGPCINLYMRGPPNEPVLSSTMLDENGIINGVQDKNTSITCTSTGGYPKPNMAWYKTSNQTTPLVDNSNMVERSNRSYALSYTFNTTRADDGALLICQTSFTIPPLLYMYKNATLYLSLKPTYPVLTITDPLIESKSNIEVATCTSDGFRPNDLDIFWKMDGTTTIESSKAVALNETFSIRAHYENSVGRKLNGKELVCVVNHTTLDEPLETKLTLNVLFPPQNATLTGVTTNIEADRYNSIALNCTSDSSNPQSNVTWYTNRQHTTSNSQFHNNDGEYNGIVVWQLLILENVHRGMDGDEIYCEVNNTAKMQVPAKSNTKKLDLQYNPTLKLSKGETVIEGSQTYITCEANSKPDPTFTWYHNNATFNNNNYIVNNGNLSVLTIPGVHRNHSGTFRCTADNGYRPNGEKDTDLTVTYKPDVEVTYRNVTVNDSVARLNCTAAGVPSIYTYSDWQHTWPGYGTINHTVKLGNDSTLILTSPTYEYSGEYTCTVSNGVSGSLNPYAGYGTAYLNIETYPIITTRSSKKVSAQLNKNTSTIIHFYSNRNDNKVQCNRGGSNHDCSYAIHTETINLPIFDSVIQTEGLAAKITFVIQHSDHFGNITVIISNDIGKASTDITVVPEGPPERPHSIGIWDISSTSVTISWIPGFHGGFDQTFLLQYSTTADTWDQYNNDTIHGGKNDGLLNANITGLQSGTRNFFRLLAYNSEGNSGYTDVYNFSTAFQETKPQYSDITAIVAGSAATGVVALIACSVVLVLSVVRYRRKKGGRTEQNRRSLSGNENIFDEDEMEINQVSVETMGIQPPCCADGASNVYTEVDKSKKRTMQGEDNTYAVVDKTKKKKNTLLGQKDIYATPMKKRVKRKKRDKGNKSIGGDVYENVQELDCFRNIVQNDEDANLYHNGDENIPYKKNLNKDGLLYADLAFDNTNKGQKKMVIHGLENATDYVDIDFSRKAEPLPDSDEEA